MEIGPRRAGDAEMTIADNSKIKNELGFTPKFSELDIIIKTSWKQLGSEKKAENYASQAEYSI
jgi:UDP-glucose 4-epimerase